MRRLIAAAAALAALTIYAAPAEAQGTGSSQGTGVSSSQRKPGSKPPAPRRPIGYRAYFTFDINMMAAKDSFDTITGSSRLLGFGGGGEVLNLWKTLFARVVWAQAGTDGERALVFENEVFPTGVPMDIGLRMFELSGGWRMHFAGQPKLVLYYGGGLLLSKYTETSEDLLEAENVSQSNRGFLGFGGIEYTLSKMLTAAVEGQYRRIADALGTDGVSKVFGEDDLGGITVRVLVGYRFGK